MTSEELKPPRYEDYLCQNCGLHPKTHVDWRCLFAPTTLLIMPRFWPILYNDSGPPDRTRVRLLCGACFIKNAGVYVLPVQGQTLTECPGCHVPFVPREVRNSFEDFGDRT